MEETHKKGKKEERICFVIAPIGKPDSDIRRRSDQVFKHIVSATVESLGYKPIRADHISEPGIITTQVIQYVVDSPLVIADLTGHNPNVFYELAVRHAIKRPLVQIIREGEQIPFDVAGTRTIYVNTNDLDSVEKAKGELLKQVESFEKGKTEIDTPISVALDLNILKESGKPEERSLAEVIGAISELRSGFLALEKRIADPESIIPPKYLRYVFQELTHRSRVFTRELIEDLMEVANGLPKRKHMGPTELKNLKEKLLLIASRMDVLLHEI